MDWINIYRSHRLHEAVNAAAGVSVGYFRAMNPDDNKTGVFNFSICSFAGSEHGCPDCKRFLKGLDMIGFRHIVPIVNEGPQIV